jgi:putative nucleotidyltransferase with HDIG domain
MKTWSAMQEATNAEILGWAESQPWARHMAACPQDPQWHAEGDVWTHTRMVCSELEQAEEWPLLDRCSQLKLLFTGLLHDAGKPATTAPDPETGRTRSPKHSQAGAERARQVLRDLGCDLAMREEIARLVRFHSRPPYLLEKPNPEREVISLSWLVNNRLLYLFAVGDTRGRKAEEMTRPEEKIHFWKSLAQEHSCYDRPYGFANDQARFLFYRDKLTSLHYTPHEDYRCTVTLMSGLPGAGKDTWLARHRSQLPVVSLDAVRDDLDLDATDNQGEVIQAAREQCRAHLRAGLDFAFNATNITRQVRRRWIDLFADYGARIEIAYLEPELATILARNKRRKHPVPENVILGLSEKAEPPTVTECHALTYFGSGC